MLKSFSLNFMATEKSARKGGRQCHGNTSRDLPPDLYELYKTDPEESYGQRKTRIQWIRRYWVEEWFMYRFMTAEYAERMPSRAPGEIFYTEICSPSPSLKLLLKASTHAWSEDRILRMLTHHLCYGVITHKYWGSIVASFNK